MLKALAEMWGRGSRFAVGGRTDDGGAFRSLSDVDIPDGFEPHVCAKFPEVGLSPRPVVYGDTGEW